MDQRRNSYLKARSAKLLKKVVRTRDGGGLKLVSVIEAGSTAVVMKAQYFNEG